MGSISVNVGGTWKTLSTVKANVSGTWKQIKQVYVNVSGTWKQVWTYAVSASGALPLVKSVVNTDVGTATGQTLTKTYKTVSGTTATAKYSSLQIGGTLGVSLWFAGDVVISFTGGTISSFSHTFDTSTVTVTKGTTWIRFQSKKEFSVVTKTATVVLNITADSLTIKTATSGICQGSGTLAYSTPGS